MRKILLTLVVLFMVFPTSIANAMKMPTTIKANEEPYFISYNGYEVIGEGELITYKGKSYLPIKDAAQFLSLSMEENLGNLYLTSKSIEHTLDSTVYALPKETIVDTYKISPKIDAHAGFVIEDGKVKMPIFSKNETQRFYPSSTTKIMTVLLALEEGDLNDVVTLGNAPNTVPSDSSKAGVRPGDVMTLEQLLYAVMLPSGNDAAAAVAEYIGGSQQKFVNMMNKKAKELGATHTSFTNPHGYHHPNLYTTAHDLALIANEAAKHPAFLKIAGTPVYTTSYKNKSGNTVTKTWKNTNQLLNPESIYYIPTVVAGKTGYTPQSRHNLVSFAVNGDHQYVVVLLRGENRQRYQDTKNLLNAAYTKRTELDRHKETVSISEFHGKVYVDGREFSSEEGILNMNGQTYIAADILGEISQNVTSVKVSEEQELKATINNELLSFEPQTATIVNGRMLVPVRSFFEKAGLQLNWDQRTGTVQAVGKDTHIKMKVNDKNVTVNGEKMLLDVPATVRNGRTLVPIRFVTEATGSTVDWGKGRTIYLQQ